MPFYGYNGGDSEKLLCDALADLLQVEETDVVAAIKNRYMKTGHIIEIAVASGYTRALGLKGWFYAHFRRARPMPKNAYGAGRSTTGLIAHTNGTKKATLASYPPS